MTLETRISSNGSGGPVRVVHMIESLRAAGAERLCVDVCCRLDRRRFSPVVLTYREGDALARVLARNGVERRHVARKNCLDLGHVRVLQEGTRTGGVRLVHTHLFGANVWGEVARWRGAGLVHVSHVHQMNVSPWAFRGLVNRVLVSRSHLILAVCETARRELVERHGLPETRVETLLNGIDVEVFRPASEAERQAAKQELGFSADELVVGIVATLRPLKDHENLLLALARLALTLPVKLAIVGAGRASREESLRTMVSELGLEERVRFLGPREDIPRILASFDVGVLCSRTEAMPMSVLEYLAAGLPVVCTAVGGIPEVLGDPPVGLLVPTSDPAALAGALDRVLVDGGLRRQMGQRGRERARQHFDIRHTVRRLEELYDNLLSSRTRAWV